MNGLEIEVFLLDFAQQLRRKNENKPDVYFTLLDPVRISPTLVLNQNVNAKNRGASGSLSKPERQKLQKI